jgi:hypothetical protein
MFASCRFYTLPVLAFLEASPAAISSQWNGGETPETAKYFSALY